MTTFRRSDRSRYGAAWATSTPHEQEVAIEPWDRGGPTRLIRSPNKAELALLRWLEAEPRTVTMGPIGQCVKRGWCRPAFKHVVEDGVQKTVAIYFVTALGRWFIDEFDRSKIGRSVEI